ncbi:MAG: hypothetical protein AB7Q45_07275, partial [Planctomycetaceae bacterium]
MNRQTLLSTASVALVLIMLGVFHRPLTGDEQQLPLLRLGNQQDCCDFVIPQPSAQDCPPDLVPPLYLPAAPPASPPSRAPEAPPPAGNASAGELVT